MVSPFHVDDYYFFKVRQSEFLGLPLCWLITNTAKWTDRLCLRRKSMILPSNILANAIRNKIKRVVTKYTNA